METGRLAFKVLIVVAVVAILGTVISALAQKAGPMTATPVAGAGGTRINAMVVVDQIGAAKYIAAGTGNGIRVYEVRRLGNQWKVTDVTKQEAAGAR